MSDPPTRKRKRLSPAETLLTKTKSIPFGFVLDELAALDPFTSPMFGCTAVYSGDRILLILRDRPTAREDNGVWLATTREHHTSLLRDLPSMRSIGVLAGGGVTGWQIIPADGEDFEEQVLRACAFVLAGDPRIGKVPARKSPRAPKTASAKKGKPAAAKTTKRRPPR